jgi:biopolymer transport protein ExbD
MHLHSSEVAMQTPRAVPNSEINVTPFLDILLVLLVIFMAAMQSQRMIEVSLPVKDSRGCNEHCQSIILEVLPGNMFALNKARFGAAELRSRLQAAYAGRPTSVLFVRGDSGVTYQDVISAFDEARGAGVQVLAIAPRSVR